MALLDVLDVLEDPVADLELPVDDFADEPEPEVVEDLLEPAVVNLDLPEDEVDVVAELFAEFDLLLDLGEDMAMQHWRLLVATENDLTTASTAAFMHQNNNSNFTTINNMFRNDR